MTTKADDQITWPPVLDCLLADEQTVPTVRRPLSDRTHNLLYFPTAVCDIILTQC